MEAVAWPAVEDCSLYLRITWSSLTFFFLLFFFVSPQASSKFLKSYKGFSLSKKVDWNTRIGSNLHAVVVGPVALYSVLFHEATFDQAWSQGVLLRCGISVTLGYIIADFIIVCWNYSLIGDVVTVVHHLVAIISYYFIVVYGMLLYFANYRQLAELSTVFVNQRWYLSASGTPHASRRFIVNGCCMVASFFLCRITTIPYYYYKCYTLWGQGRIQLGTGIIGYMLVNCIVLDVINIYWMVQMIQGGLKVLTNNNERKTALKTK